MNSFIKKQRAGIFIFLLAILFLFIGICRQEHKTVEKKSNIICLECIGIG